MDSVWSPDGKTIAYLSDATGEYEIYVRNQDGTGAPRQLTRNATSWKFPPVFSRDGKKLLFSDRSLRLQLLDVASGTLETIDSSDREDLLNYSISPDGRTIAYEKTHANRIAGIALYSLDTKKVQPLGDGFTPDSEPVFSHDGKYLFFLSSRDYKPTFSDYEFNFVYDNATRVYAVSLNDSVPALFAPKSDEENGKTAEKTDKSDAAKAGKDAKDKPAEKKPAEVVTLEPAGLMTRTIALPGLKPGNYNGLDAAEGAVYYIKGDAGETALYRYDLKERKEEKVLDGVTRYNLSADGKKLLWKVARDWGIADAKAGLKAGDGKLDLSSLRMKIDLKAEWRQIWSDGIRVTRDWFYDPKMHGYDWNALAKRYGALVPFVAHRGDLDFLFGELLSELEAGHTYVTSGDEPKVERIAGGMLGADLVAHASGRYLIAKIYPGENWHEDYRSPLTEQGVGVKEGEFLLAIDGAEVKTSDNPYAFLENKAGKPVILTVNTSASADGARKVTVRPIASELNLFYLDWVRSRMALADKLSGGKVGYIHLPDTALDGNRMLQKLFYAQAKKQALIVDDRYNGGGFIPDRTIEYLTRKTLSWWSQRGIEGFTTPGFAHDGPKVMLINGYSSSGGDALPYYFKKNNLGKLIGTRTWGGLIGLSGNPGFVDGGSLNVPTFRIYDERGEWIIENEGVSPDIEVIDLPELRMAGRDPSLEKGIEVLLEELKKSPPPAPKVPVPPDMTKN
jgi:tricorn protease